MRVIGGSAGGRRLQGPPEARRGNGAGRKKAPTGRGGGPASSKVSGTRPTSDLVRGAIFDMLDAAGAEYARVLDLYAGTGALGIEALSRGDGTADFVEQDAGAAAVVRANLRACGFEERGKVHVLTSARAAQRLAGSGPYTLILADPPYYDEGAPAVVDAVAGSALADEATVLVFEHARRLEPQDHMGRLGLWKSRRHGDTVVSIYRGEEAG
jgi:16S rRNA (guanine966-N2)-methyltransferase